MRIDRLRSSLTLRTPPGDAGEAARPAISIATATADGLLPRYRERLVSAAPMLATLPDGEQRVCVATMVEGWLDDDGMVPGALRDRALVSIVDDIAGFGPLEQLLGDDSVTEIMVNGPDETYVERNGVIAPAGIRFRDGHHIRCVIERFLVSSGRRLDDASPMVDARLADGSRLNAVLPPVSLHGPILTIRRAARHRRTVSDLLDGASIDRRMAAFLHAAVLGRCSVLVTGGTGTGKTTLMGALAALIPAGQRIVTLEDVAELNIDHPHVVPQECRPSAGDGPMRVSLRDLVKNSLRMRPDRIIVGEVRDVEAADMIQAMNTGHEGSMATLHANSVQDGLGRLEAMLATAYGGLSVATLRNWIGTAIDVLVHCDRTVAGHRYVSVIAACELDERGTIHAVPLFRSHGQPGDFAACGEVPRECLERMAQHGVRFPADLFARAA